ncbi:O-antigen polymerase [Xanthobacter flavus]|uniref:O-antigen polymerase n=1 Tax=Xanthobacter flavus TaxID=281 RepID=UPI0037291F60
MLDEATTFLVFMFSLILLVVLMVFVRKLEREHFTPLSMWLLSWTALYALSMIFGSVYDYTLAGLSSMLFLIFAYAFGGICAVQLLGIRKFKLEAPVKALRAPIWIEPICILAGLYGAFQLRSGFAEAGVGSGDFLSSAAANAAALYSGQYVLPTTANIGYAMLMAGAYFSVLRFAVRRQSKLGAAFLALIVLTAMLWTFTTTTRIYTAMVVIWALCSFLAASVINGTPISLFNRKIVLRGLAVLAPLVFFILLVQSIRLNKGGVGDLSDAFDHMRPWIGGTISAYSVWLDQTWDDDLSFGSYLFRAPLKMLGVETQDRFEILRIGNGQYSNATTMLRAVIQDFGIFNGALVLFALGFLSVKSYKDTLRGSYIGSVFLVVFYAIALFASNNWIFLYGSRIYAVIAMCGLVQFVLWTNGWRAERGLLYKPSFPPNRFKEARAARESKVPFEGARPLRRIPLRRFPEVRHER